MKKQRLPILVLLLSLWAFGAAAQYDDMYYNPDTDATVESYEAVKSDRPQQLASNSERDPRRTGEGYYDDEPYDYYYTSRIRRFHRPMYGFGYFDPYYIDSYYYNPYMIGGSTMFIYDSPFAYRRYMRNRAFYDPFWYPGAGYAFGPSYGFGYSPGFSFNVGIGFGSGFGYPSYGFGSGFGYGGGYYGGYGGYGGGFLYCPPTYGGGYAYNTPRSENSVISSRPRTATARSVAPSTGFDRNPRSTNPTVVGRSLGRDNEGLRTTDRMREIRRQAGTSARTRVRTAATDRTSPQIRTRNAPSSRLYTRGSRANTPTRSFTTPSTRQQQRSNTSSWDRNNYNNNRPSIRTQPSTRTTVSPRSSSSTRTSTPRSSSSRRGNNE